MSEATEAFGSALGAMPVFPLPGVVLFPGALLPLHVFEPRYRAMLADSLASHRFMAMAFVLGEGDVRDRDLREGEAIDQVVAVGEPPCHRLQAAVDLAAALVDEARNALRLRQPDGVGEDAGDLQPFNAQAFANALTGAS